MRRVHELGWMSAGLVLSCSLLTCGPDPAGTTDGTEAGSSTDTSAGTSASTSTSTSAGTSASASSDVSATSTGDGTASTSATASTGTSTGTPPPCTPHPVVNCQYPAVCTDTSPWHWGCGGDSPFDADGCPLPACVNDDDCAPGAHCQGYNSGASGFFCFDSEHQCICGSDPLGGDDMVFVCV